MIGDGKDYPVKKLYSNSGQTMDRGELIEKDFINIDGIWPQQRKLIGSGILGFFITGLVLLFIFYYLITHYKITDFAHMLAIGACLIIGLFSLGASILILIVYYLFFSPSQGPDLYSNGFLMRAKMMGKLPGRPFIPFQEVMGFYISPEAMKQNKIYEKYVKQELVRLNVGLTTYEDKFQECLTAVSDDKLGYIVIETKDDIYTFERKRFKDLNKVLSTIKGKVKVFE
jgi:hypothetical protein